MPKHDTPYEPTAPAVLAVDVGGSHVKIVVNGHPERRRFVSGKRLTAAQMVTGVLELAEGVDYGFVTVGVPAPVLTTALYSRFASRNMDDFANRLLSAMRKQFGGHDEKAA